MKNIDFGFLKRRKYAHKGNYGHILILAGSRGFTGAACLCARSAMLSGAGLVTVGIPESLNVLVARKLTEAMTKPLAETKEGTLALSAFKEIKAILKKIDVLAIGPGLSQHKTTQRLIRKIISEVDRPMVIDADGLNALKNRVNILKKGTFVKIVTPHPGEMARLLGMKTQAIQKNRKALAKQFACMYNSVTVLKGHGTVVADTSGKVYINKTGNPGMAKGGTGDVLTGIIAAFCAQGAKVYEAAKAAVYIHGLAADLAVKEKGLLSLLASDIIDVLPEVLKKIYKKVK